MVLKNPFMCALGCKPLHEWDLLGRHYKISLGIFKRKRMGPNIQVLIIVGTIICFSSILYARPGEWKNGTATFYKRPYVRKY
jgi:hypothetical protein